MVGNELHGVAQIGCSSQLGELADDVLLLWLLRLLMLGGEEDAIEPEAAINGLTKEKIQQTLQEFLAQDNLIQVVMNPANAAEAE